MPVPKMPLGVADIIDTNVTPWYREIDQRAHRGRKGLGLIVSNPYTGAGYASQSTEPVVARFVAAKRIHSAFEEARESGALCCAEAMLDGEYADGCALDADQILQRACYGGHVIWA